MSALCVLTLLDGTFISHLFYRAKDRKPTVHDNRHICRFFLELHHDRFHLLNANQDDTNYHQSLC